MYHLKQIGFLPLLVILITFVSPNQWSRIPIGNTTIVWIVCFLTIISVLWCKRQYFLPNNPGDYRIIHIYFLWMIIGVVRGIFDADNYWEWKQLITGTLSLSLPILVYAFSIPEILQKTLQLWVKIALPAFGLLFFWVLSRDAYHFYLGPVLLLTCFLPILSKKWKIIFLGLLLLMIFADFGARSQVIKAVVALLMSVAYLLSKYLDGYALRMAHRLCYIVPVVLLALGITGVFNPFKAMSDKADGKYTQQTRSSSGVTEQEDLAADTRTFIYEEVISSAVRHQYVWQGRTPARGNDSWWFGAYNAEELKTKKYERHRNELCHPNVFTWLGIIGMALYSLIYFKSSYLAVYRSNNIWMKLLGVFIAFRWAYGWVEDVNEFNILNIALWMTIAMGFSEEFRAMSDEEIETWVTDILKGRR